VFEGRRRQTVKAVLIVAARWVSEIEEMIETESDRNLKILPPVHLHPNFTPKKQQPPPQNQFPYRD